nr:NADH dehydrogenase subunit 4 [Ceriodaphnia dubia]
MLKFGFMCLFFPLVFGEWILVIGLSMVSTFLWMMFMSNYNLGMIDLIQLDNVAFLLGGLSLWITSLMFLMSFYIKFSKNFPGMFSFFCSFMLFFLLLSFSTSNLLIYYISFESTLIPIFLLVMGWGYQPERVIASYFLLFYTLAASLPLLLGILWVDFSDQTLDLNLLSFSSFFNTILFFSMITAFLVKMPIYIGHLWLPKAHVEAPVAGSMILAGILLKLGGYGLIRTLPFLQFDLFLYAPWVISLAILGGIMASFICIRQTDCKSLVAYSSIAHMALVVVGLCFNSFMALAGSIIIMIAHGLCSSGLFSLVGMIYERSGTRSLMLLRSMITITPIMSLWWFIFSISNMAAPPTPSLAGEIYIFISSMSWLMLIAIMVGILSFLAGAYNLYLFISIQHGNKLSSSTFMVDTYYREHLVLFFHFIPFILFLPVLVDMYS